MQEGCCVFKSECVLGVGGYGKAPLADGVDVHHTVAQHQRGSDLCSSWPPRSHSYHYLPCFATNNPVTQWREILIYTLVSCSALLHSLLPSGSFSSPFISSPLPPSFHVFLFFPLLPFTRRKRNRIKHRQTKESYDSGLYKDLPLTAFTPISVTQSYFEC